MSGVDLERIQRIKEQKEKEHEERQGRTDLFKAELGDNQIRVGPPASDEISFYEEVHLHYVQDPDTGKGNPRRCLKDEQNKSDEDCPACQAVAELFAGKTKESTREAKELKEKERYLMNVLDRRDGIWKLYIAPYTVWIGLMGLFGKKGWEDITHSETGKDVVVVKRKTGKLPRDVEYSVVPLPGDTPLEEGWEEKMVDLGNVFKRLSYDQMVAVLAGEEIEEEEIEDDGNGIAVNEEETKKEVEEEEPPNCFGDYDPKDKFCAKCEWMDRCKAKKEPEKEEKVEKPSSAQKMVDRIKRRAKK